MINLPDIEDRTLAVTSFDKNIVVTAGAGTGKTTLLVDRIIYLLMREPDPLKITEIVALTFTNKAANEMKIRLKDRLQGLVSASLRQDDISTYEDRVLKDIIGRYRLSRDKIGERAYDAINNLEKAQICTLHSFSAYILRLYPIEAGIDPRFKEDDGSEFEEQFDREWEGWLDIELSADSPHRSLWEVVLYQTGLESLKSFAREICKESISIRILTSKIPLNPPLLKGERGGLQEGFEKGLSDELRRWLEGEREKVRDLLSKYTKSRKIEQLLSKTYDVFDDVLLKRDISHIIEDIPSGPPPAGWDLEDYSKTKQAINIAKGLSLSDDPFINNLLILLMPFAIMFRKKFTLSGNISFDGLLTYCRDLLKTRPKVREELKRRFKAILVDEFQDTDPIQYEIILYLSEVLGRCEEEWRNIELAQGKIFIVGDPKQSIYAFRRADIEAYSRVVDMIISCQSGLKTSLSTSFRSHDRIIEVVNEFFRHLIKHRELLQPEYVNLLEHPEHKASLPIQRVELRVIDGRGDGDIDASMATRLEAEAIGKWLKEELLGIETIFESGGNKAIVSPGHVAILFRKLTDVYEYIEVFRRYDIPYLVEGEKHFYATQEVVDFVNLLRAIDNPFDSLALVGVLRSPLGGLSDREIYEIESLSLLDYRTTGELSDRLPSSSILNNLYGLLRILHRDVGTKTVPDAINYIFETLPVLELAASSYQGEQAVANLIKIQKMAESLSDRSNITLKGFTTLLEKRVKGLEEEGESLLAEESVDAVRMLSIHKAKGLEFPVVILAGMHSSSRGGEDQVSVMYDWSSNEIGFKVGDHRNHAAVMLHDKRVLRDKEEQKRLLYVAMTRARECLVLSGTLYGRINKGSFLSLLSDVTGDSIGDKSIDEIVIGDGRIRQTIIDHRDCVSQYSSMRGQKSEVRSQSGAFKREGELDAFVDLWTSRSNRYEAINSKRLFITPSKLEEGGKKFLSFREMDRVRVGLFSGEKAEISAEEKIKRERALLIGTLSHYILEQWDFENDISRFKNAIKDVCSKFTPPQFAKEKLSIIEDLENIFDSFSTSAAYDQLKRVTIIGREVPFTIPWEGQVMDGVIDLIFKDGDSIYVADYKTDNISEKDIENKIKDYTLSGKIYMEAVRRCLREKAAGFKLIFLRPGKSIDIDLT